jgi:hypothetical protein
LEPRYRFLAARLLRTTPLTVWYNAVFYLSNGEKRVNGSAASGGYLITAAGPHVTTRARELLERAAGMLAAGADVTAELEQLVHLDCLRVLAWHEDSLSQLPPALAFTRLDFTRLVTGADLPREKA